jgi:pyruvate,orthophosphate dikinase
VEQSFAEQTELRTLLEWADGFRRLGVWANADYPRDAAKAVEFGAEGIGLTRTEHMFFETERLPFVHEMILYAREATALERELQRARAAFESAEPARKAEAEAEYRKVEERYRQSEAVRRYYGALAELEKFQVEDFKGLFRVMGHRPVVIRLLDPPLHEFLPRYEDLLVEVTEMRARGVRDEGLAEKERLLELVESMREFNPMLGLRGCRLGILFPAIYEMQVRAIFRAVCDLKAEGLDPHPEIMIPLVGHINELAVVREQLERVARQVMAEKGQQVSYKFGTMIEVPRAALTADQIARYAEFFSFGTNDLTQMVFGMSRDDAEAKFLFYYVEQGILPANPFQTLDADGVGRLMEMGFKLGRETRPDLEVGICGEHGGDPESIFLCHRIGLNYVSASPYRIPVARLAAAQAALAEATAAAAQRYA